MYTGSMFEHGAIDLVQVMLCMSAVGMLRRGEMRGCGWMMSSGCECGARARMQAGMLISRLWLTAEESTTSASATVATSPPSPS
jgi:hypothetical protein